MSHPSPQHERSNEYPEDQVAHYPRKKIAKSKGPLHNVANRLNAKTKALKERMNEVGGRFTKR